MYSMDRTRNPKDRPEDPLKLFHLATPNCETRESILTLKGGNVVISYSVLCGYEIGKRFGYFRLFPTSE